MVLVKPIPPKNPSSRTRGWIERRKRVLISGGQEERDLSDVRQGEGVAWGAAQRGDGW